MSNDISFVLNGTLTVLNLWGTQRERIRLIISTNAYYEQLERVT